MWCVMVAGSLHVSSLTATGLVEYVNPFIGTVGGGNTFPGAVLPWGMVSVSPHTMPGAPSGYRHGAPNFYGFGMVHLSGTGCADLGSIIVTAAREVHTLEPEEYKCSYGEEKASPGFYSVLLHEPNVRAEVTATQRCGMIRWTALESGDVNILIDVGRSLNLVGGGSIRVRSNAELEGENLGGGFCGEANRHRVYFVARFSQPAISYNLLIDDRVVEGTQATANDKPIGASFRFNAEASNQIMMKVGISHVSIANARENLEAEIAEWDFEAVRTDAAREWERQLSRIRVEGGSRRDRVKFYTALYHTMIHPSVISDVNGDYPRMGRSGIGNVSARERYSVFSLWDTYRTLHPLMTLAYPERQSVFVQSMLEMYRESGWLPKWELAGNETYMMVGDPATIVIADSYVKGIRDFDISLAYEAMKKPTVITPGQKAPPIRNGYHEQLEYGYIPFQQDTTEAWWVWGPVSTSLEYGLADWAVAKTAQALGWEKEAAEYFRRAQFYKNYFDPETQLLRPKLKNGTWLIPFDPLQTEGSGCWSGSGGPGYVEGNAWNYTWFVPHDVEGLITLFGGPASFVAKLQECFDEQYFTINNEPDIAYPYLFTYVRGEEARTQALVSEIMAKKFGADADGLPGNDDAGTISAWFVFSALGFYPACPAVDEYRLGKPLFERATISLNEDYFAGREFIVQSKTGSSNGFPAGAVELNGRELSTFSITHTQVTAGGNLAFWTREKNGQ